MCFSIGNTYFHSLSLLDIETHFKLKDAPPALIHVPDFCGVKAVSAVLCQRHGEELAYALSKNITAFLRRFLGR
jgi:hypothetical protein